MYGVEFKPDLDILEAIEDGARTFPNRMNTAVKRNLGRFERRVLRILQTEPDEPGDNDYPLRWKSERQRRFVMAKLRDEGNLPYKRTHELIKAWKLSFRLDRNGGTFTAENDQPEADFVIGDNQQPFLIDIGWEPAAQTLVQAQEDANDLLIETFYTVTAEY